MLISIVYPIKKINLFITSKQLFAVLIKKKYGTVGVVPKFKSQIVKRDKIATSNMEANT
jgi:hypothetical protein